MMWDQTVMKRLKSLIKQSIFRSCAMAQLLAHVTANNSKNARLAHQIFCIPITCVHIIIITTQCTYPYTGDGSLCVLDSDGDGYPDRALRTCSTGDQQMYCSADTCPFAPNPDQTDTSPCVGDDETGVH